METKSILHLVVDALGCLGLIGLLGVLLGLLVGPWVQEEQKDDMP